MSYIYIFFNGVVLTKYKISLVSDKYYLKLINHVLHFSLEILFLNRPKSPQKSQLFVL